jgi:Lrp/AsnC family transcriptional regulator for asnA, asnC and gidA
MAWLGVTLSEGADLERAAAMLGEVPGIDYVIVPSGRYDLLCELVCRDSNAMLATLDDRIGAFGEVAHVDTFLCLRVLYKTTAGAWGAGRSLALPPTAPPDLRRPE